jgi:hypothetical protein
MRPAALLLQNAIRLIALVMLALGFMFWGGRSLELIPLHMRLGEVLVVLLWILSWLSLRAGVAPKLVIMAMLYGLAVILFATYMGRLLPGGAHEVIRVLHFLIGIGAVGFAEVIGGRMKRGSGFAPKKGARA